MKTGKTILALALLALLGTYGCSSPDTSDDPFGDGGGAAMPADSSMAAQEAAAPEAPLPGNDAFGQIDPNAPAVAAPAASQDSFGGTAAPAADPLAAALPAGTMPPSGGSLADEIDKQVLTDIYIDPAAPAVDPGATVSQARFNPVPGVGYSKKHGGSKKGGTYTVKSGDSLWKIAKNNGCSIKALCKANNISENDILRIGKKLTIPGKKSSSSSSSSYVSGGTYTVKSGDSFYKIGKKLGVNYLKLQKFNGGNPNLMPGQVIKLP